MNSPLKINLILFSIFIGMMYVVGCSPKPDELYQQGTLAAQAKEFDKAIALFRKIHEVAPKDVNYKYQALFGEAEVYSVQGDLEKQAELLEKIKSNKEMQRHHEMVTEKLEENYIARAKKEKLKSDPAKAKKLLYQAITLNPKSEANRELVDYLLAQGDTAYKEKRYSNAEVAFEEIKALNINDESLKKRLLTSMNNVQFQQYLKKGEQLFATQKADLEKRGLYDQKTKTFFLQVVTPVDGRVNKKNLEEMIAKGVATAEPLAQTEIAKLVKEIFETTKEIKVIPSLFTVTDKSFAKRSRRIKRDKKRVQVTDFTYKLSIGLNQVYHLAHQGSK